MFATLRYATCDNMPGPEGKGNRRRQEKGKIKESPPLVYFLGVIGHLINLNKYIKFIRINELWSA